MTSLVLVALLTLSAVHSLSIVRPNVPVFMYVSGSWRTANQNGSAVIHDESGSHRVNVVSRALIFDCQADRSCIDVCVVYMADRIDDGEQMFPLPVRRQN